MVSFYDVFGGVSTFIVSVQILRHVFPWIYENFVGPKLFGSPIKLKEMGEWALVTGATDGIGKSYAKALAKKGINIILVSRSLTKLETVAKEIETEFQVQTKIIDVDFTSGPQIYEKIEKQILGLDIGILVNNVGISYANPEYFLMIPDRDKFIQNVITCNILSVTSMLQLVLPGMVEKNKGVVINISSMSATIPNPMLSIYAASKVFVDKFTEDMATEYSKSGIIFQSVLPGPVATNMSKIRSATWMACTPQVYVQSALKTLGLTRHTTGYYPHALLKLVINTMESLVPSIAQKITLKTMQNIRSRAMKKLSNKNVTDTH
uniref:Putative 17 beta-hydroxysteroid dehydrogenase type 3 n=1 Tax=Corethrella appendiculata TaxID=1370023 RepID=U5ES67_9DIPT